MNCSSMILATICIFLLGSINSLFIQPSSHVLKISKFLQSCFVLPKQIQNLRVAILMRNDSFEAQDTITEWLSNEKVISHTFKIFTEIKAEINSTELFTHTIVFIELVEDINNSIQEMLNDSSRWTTESKYVFVITNTGDDSISRLGECAQSLWKSHQILNFIIVYYANSSKPLQVLGYQPFMNEFEHFSHSTVDKCTSHFSNKVKNLYGSKIRITVLNSPPFCYKIDGQYYGTDIEFVKLFIKLLNGSIDYKEVLSFGQLQTEVINENADMTGTGSLMYPKHLQVISYPHRFVYQVVLVAKASQILSIANLSTVFDFYTWLTMFVVMIVCLFLKMYLFQKIRAQMENKSTLIHFKILLIAFSIFYIIFTSIYQSWVITILTYPKYAPDIDTIDDLVKSKLPLYIQRNWTEMVSKKLLPQIVYVSSGKVLEHVMTRKPDGAAYAIMGVLTHSLFINETFTKLYYQMKNPIGSSFLTLILQENSPYKEILKTILLRCGTMGIFSRDFGSAPIVAPKVESIPKNLNLEQLHGVFILWILGIVVGCLVITGEIVFNLQYSSP